MQTRTTKQTSLEAEIGYAEMMTQRKTKKAAREYRDDEKYMIKMLTSVGRSPGDVLH